LQLASKPSIKFETIHKESVHLWWYYKVIDYKDDDTKGRGQPDYLDDETKLPAWVRSLLVIWKYIWKKKKREEFTKPNTTS